MVKYMRDKNSMLSVVLQRDSLFKLAFAAWDSFVL